MHIFVVIAAKSKPAKIWVEIVYSACTSYMYMWQIITAIPAIVLHADMQLSAQGAFWGGGGGGEAVDNNEDVFL